VCDWLICVMDPSSARFSCPSPRYPSDRAQHSGHSKPVNSISFHPEGQIVLSGSWDGLEVVVFVHSSHPRQVSFASGTRSTRACSTVAKPTIKACVLLPFLRQAGTTCHRLWTERSSCGLPSRTSRSAPSLATLNPSHDAPSRHLVWSSLPSLLTRKSRCVSHLSSSVHQNGLGFCGTHCCAGVVW
jgi:hypothetical protein